MTNSGRLAKFIYNLAVLQAVQNKGITADQSPQIKTLLTKVEGELLDDLKAGVAQGDLQKILRPEQRDAIEFMATTAGQGIRVKNPERPFETDQAKEGINSLLSSLNARQEARR